MAKRTRAKKRPVGRDEIVPAVMDAASRLFSERGPDAVSVRDVAAEANVNHALVHRHFGSKDELVRLVVAEALERVARAWPEDGVADPETLRIVIAAARRERAAVRIIAWALMAGQPVDDLVRDHPVANRALAMRGDSDQPQVAVAAITAMLLGWAVFEPWVNRASGVTNVPGYDPETAIADVVGAILRSAGTPALSASA